MVCATYLRKNGQPYAFVAVLTNETDLECPIILWSRCSPKDRFTKKDAWRIAVNAGNRRPCPFRDVAMEIGVVLEEYFKVDAYRRSRGSLRGVPESLQQQVREMVAHAVS